MGNYICPKCGSKLIIGMEVSVGGISPKICKKCGAVMEKFLGEFGQSQASIGNSAEVNMGRASIDIGGNLVNEGKMKAHDTNLSVGKDLRNTGEFLINEPERIKETLLEIAKSAKNVTEIGKLVSKKIFGW